MAALGRKAGPMRHRLEPHGGANNEQADLIEQIDVVCPNCQLIVDDPYEHVSNYGPSYTCEKKGA